MTAGFEAQRPRRQPDLEFTRPRAADPGARPPGQRFGRFVPEVIRILTTCRPEGLHLSVFPCSRAGISPEVIHALGGRRDEMSNKILMGFEGLDEEVRIQVAMKSTHREKS
jgi:hypothetical protein